MALFFPLLCASCFTGVESTPRINASDVRRQQADTRAPEADFMAPVKAEPPSRWRTGKEFRVANDRISLIFTPESDNSSALARHTLRFVGFAPARTLMGDNATDATFRSDDGRTLVYRISGFDAARLDSAAALPVPFAIDLDMVAATDSLMRGRSFFIRTPAWYTQASRKAVQGLRHVEVTVDSVVPGDENFGAAVCFTVADPALRAKAMPDGVARMVLMGWGQGANATRSFDALFSFTDPRKLHPEIKDDVWALIIDSKVREGMSRDECRLALGTPPSLERIPTPGGMAERWRYSDGVYLIFEDGFLTRFRL